MDWITKIGIILFLGGTLVSLFVEGGTIETISITLAILGLVFLLTARKKAKKEEYKEVLEKKEEENSSMQPKE